MDSLLLFLINWIVYIKKLLNVNNWEWWNGILKTQLILTDFWDDFASGTKKKINNNNNKKLFAIFIFIIKGDV